MIKPKVTEKNVARAKKGYYTFEVPYYSTYGQVRNEIEELFLVKVKRLWFLSRGGENPSSRQRAKHYRLRSRQVIASLKSGQISVFGAEAEKGGKTKADNVKSKVKEKKK
ncbi:MAG: 50S ribosomal protein L23 [Patescibacteria group bacterium]|nr:50S ribosomal protein L23 [Patescibacteria group bacterium]